MKSTKNLFNSFVLIAAVTLILGSYGCKDPDKQDLDYDRSALLTQAARTRIAPAYEALTTEALEMKAAFDAFINAPDLVNLAAARSAHFDAWTQWEICSPFEFGPAEERSLRASVNTWPVDRNQVNNNVQAGTWDLATASNIDARGFPALDYLLHGYASDDASIIAAFQADANLRDYLIALAEDLIDLFEEVNFIWSAAGNNFIEAFEANRGTDVGSSTGGWVNQLNFDLEQLKNARLGIPMGRLTLGTAIPEQVEAYYSGQSLELARTHLIGLRDIYMGIGLQNQTGYGLHDALLDVEATYNGGSLAEAISTQFDATITAWDNINGPLSEAVTQQVPATEAAYTEIQKLTVLLKTDMASALGILITYTDNDGD